MLKANTFPYEKFSGSNAKLQSLQALVHWSALSTDNQSNRWCGPADVSWSSPPGPPLTTSETQVRLAISLVAVATVVYSTKTFLSSIKHKKNMFTINQYV